MVFRFSEKLSRGGSSPYHFMGCRRWAPQSDFLQVTLALIESLVNKNPLYLLAFAKYSNNSSAFWLQRLTEADLVLANNIPSPWVRSRQVVMWQHSTLFNLDLMEGFEPWGRGTLERSGMMWNFLFTRAGIPFCLLGAARGVFSD